MVKARLERDANGSHRIFVQRAKFKHWFELGKHRLADRLRKGGHITEAEFKEITSEE